MVIPGLLEDLVCLVGQRTRGKTDCLTVTRPLTNLNLFDLLAEDCLTKLNSSMLIDVEFVYQGFK